MGEETKKGLTVLVCGGGNAAQEGGDDVGLSDVELNHVVWLEY